MDGRVYSKSAISSGARNVVVQHSEEFIDIGMLSRLVILHRVPTNSKQEPAAARSDELGTISWSYLPAPEKAAMVLRSSCERALATSRADDIWR